MTSRPRIGFLGVGWIGRNRMEAILATGLVEPVAIADPSPEMAAAAAALAPDARAVADLDALLESGVDGVVIATPSAHHAAQAIAALERGAAVFCQKPLGRDAAEVAAAVDAARRADRLLRVDLSYRHTDGMRRIRALVQEGALGHVHAADLVFHNAYGPDKPWFYDRALSGGGCVMDLGVHLVDLAIWTLGAPEVLDVRSHLSARGVSLGPAPDEVEDFAVADLMLDTGTLVRLTCSWRLPIGRDAAISASFYGTEGGAEFRNVDGSFYDFVAERFDGTARHTLSHPPDTWGGRAAAAWARRLAQDISYDRSAEELVVVARALDGIYGRRYEGMAGREQEPALSVTIGTD